jgi:membrane protein implicated in regulation of membrane protease activity
MGFLDITSFIFWGVLAAVFLGAELMTTGLVSIWFCIGAVVTMLAARGGASVIVQFVVFAVISGALLVLTRPFVNKVLRLKKEATNLDRIIGETAVVTEEINYHKGTGAVKVDGKTWTAVSDEKERTIPKDTEVKILKIEGVKVIVK